MKIFNYFVYLKRLWLPAMLMFIPDLFILGFARSRAHRMADHCDDGGFRHLVASGS